MLKIFEAMDRLNTAKEWGQKAEYDSAHEDVLIEAWTINLDEEPNALLSAIFAGFDEVAEILLERGAGVKKDENGRTPLHYAVSRLGPSVIKLLIKGGSDLDAKDVYGETPLHIAILNGTPEVAKLLIQAGSDPNAKMMESNSTPLHCAVSRNMLEIVDLLI